MKKYVVAKLIPIGLFPKEKVVFKTKNLSWAKFFAKIYKKFFLVENMPFVIHTIDTSTGYELIVNTEWIVPWSIKDEKKELKTADWEENRCDVQKIERGAQEPIPQTLKQVLEKEEQFQNENVAKTLLTPEQFQALKSKNSKIILP